MFPIFFFIKNKNEMQIKIYKALKAILTERSILSEIWHLFIHLVK
jgi:hypothetical protein